MPPAGSPNSDRRSILKAAGALGAFLGSTGLAGADDGDDGGSNASELLVGVSSSVPNAESAVASALSGDGRVVHSNEAISYATIELPANTPEQAREQIEETLGGMDHVEYVEENATLESFATPNDPYYGNQHAPQQVGCEGAWDETFGDSDVVVSVVDQGVAYDHENLEANVDDRVGEVFAGRGSDPYPTSSSETHGTIVAGIAAGETNNGTGHAGISDCSILSARALDASGRGSLADIADAIVWSADRGVDVVNLSLGSASNWRTLANACQYAVDNGCLLVAAAGNDGGAVSYPAAYGSVVAVSALDANGRLASFSNRGSQIDLAAPGTRVLSTTLNDGYSRASGTSMAAPVVSGVAGLVLSAYPDLSPEELREHLQRTATDVGLSSRAQGHGRIDASAAVGTVPDGHEPDDGDDPDDGADEPDDPDDGADEPDDGDDDSDEVPDDLLAFVTEPDARFAGHEFTADGPIEFADAPYESPSGGSIEGGTYAAEDFVEERDDGTWRAGGVTGGGNGDAYRVDGAVTSIDIGQPDAMWVELGGERLSPEEVIDRTGGNDDDGDDGNEGDDGDDGNEDDGNEDDGNEGDGGDGDDGNDEPDETRCGAETETVTADGSLTSGWWGYYDRWNYALRTATPCGVSVSIDGPSNADFDLYVAVDRQPTRSRYDAASTGVGSDESVDLDLSGDGTVYVLVYAESGSGSYSLRIDERGR